MRKILRQRKPNRLRHFDYSQNGWYFVTICTQNRENIFGEIINKRMILNSAGLIVKKWWIKMEEKYKNVYLDIYQIMPNHIHGIIVIKNKQSVGDDLCVVPNNKNIQGGHTGPLDLINVYGNGHFMTTSYAMKDRYGQSVNISVTIH